MAIGTGLAAALDPSFILVSSEIQSEALFLVLLLVAGFLLLVCADRPSSNFGVLAGGFLGLAALTRPSALALAPLLLCLLGDRRYPGRVRAHLAASAFLGLALALFPWTLRNALVFRELIPVSDVGGLNFAIGNSERMLRFCGLRTRAEHEAWARETEEWTGARMSELAAARRDHAGGHDRALVRRTLSERLADPGTTVRLLVVQGARLAATVSEPAVLAAARRPRRGSLLRPLYALAASGLAIAPRRRASLFALVFLIVTMAVHVVTLVSWRYRVPYWDPVLLLYGVFGAWRRSR